MSFSDTFINSCKQPVPKPVQISDKDLVASEIVARLEKCIKSQFTMPKKGDYDTSFICDLVTKPKISDADVNLVAEALKEPMKQLNMTKVDDHSAWSDLKPCQYSVFQSNFNLYNNGFDYVKCCMRFSNVEKM